MDRLQIETNKIKNNRNNKQKFMQYCLNTLHKSDENTLNFYEQLIHHPETIDKQALYDIFKLLDLNIEVLSEEVKKNNGVPKEKINEIVLQLMDINRNVNDSKIDQMIIDLLEIKNKEGCELK